MICGLRKILKMKEELYFLLIKLLSAKGINVNKEELNLQLLSHPSYPSLHALTGVLNHFNIENLAIEVSAEAETLELLPNPFIAHLVSEEKDFVLVEKRDDVYSIHYREDKIEAISATDFLRIWDGVVLVVEKGEGIKKEGRPPILNKLIGVSFALLCVLLAYFVFYNSHIFSLLHFVLSLCGLYFSVEIIKHEFGIASAASAKMCSLSEQTSCEEVLNSKGSQLFGILKLSEISLLAFSTFILAWFLFFLSGNSNAVILAFLSLGAIPVIFYSLYYQYFVVGKWCPLCLSIAAVLSLQAAAVLFADLPAFLFDFRNLLLFLISFLTTLISASFLLPIIRRKTSLEKLEIEHYQFKRKFSLFNAIYSNTEALEMIPPIAGEIVFGEREAALELILITNPFCYFCKQMHQDLQAFLKQAPEDIRVIIRFNVDPEKKENKVYRITSALLDIYNREGREAIMNALHEVYAENVDLEKWMQDREKTQTSYEEILTTQRSWCQANDINFTPVLIVNGRPFPKEYDKGDLVYFMEDLIGQ